MAGQRACPLGGLGDRLQILLPLLVGEVGAAEQEIRRAADHRHQIVEVVGDAAGQLAERLQLLRLGERGAGLLQFLFAPACAR